MDVLKIFNLLLTSTILIVTAIIFGFILLENSSMKMNTKKVVIIIISILLYSYIISSLNGTIKTLILWLLYIILYKELFRKTYSECVFIAFLYAILIIIPDTIFLLFLIYVLKIPSEICYTHYAGSLISTIAVCILFIMLVYIFRRWIKKLLNIKIDNNKAIIIYTILTLGCVIIIFYKATDNITVNKNLIEGILIMITFVVILYSLMRQKIENSKIVEKYDKLLEFIKKYEKEIEEQRALRHESKNQLLTIKTKLIEKQVSDKIIEYIDSLINEHIGFSEEKYGKFQYLPANGIKGLFYYKSMEAEEKKIKLSINIAEKVENSILKDLPVEDFKQLGRMVGVYLDNAIEASSISKDKKLGIEIYERAGDIIMIISNTYNGVIDTESVGKVKYSTKGKNRGYGLMLVNKILSTSKRFVAERNVTDKLYVQKLIIKKSIRK